jgi:hypothetical protein
MREIAHNWISPVRIKVNASQIAVATAGAAQSEDRSAKQKTTFFDSIGPKPVILKAAAQTLTWVYRKPSSLPGAIVPLTSLQKCRAIYPSSEATSVGLQVVRLHDDVG